MNLEKGLEFMMKNSSNYVYIVPKEGAEAIITQGTNKLACALMYVFN